MVEIPRGSGRVLRIQREAYKGKYFTHVREWFVQAGELRPGKGVALRDDELKRAADELSKLANEVG